MKKVLIITYYWPPSGGIGVLRCLKFAKYLRDFGWEPIIFTAEDAHYPSIDHSNNKDIPQGITILKQKITEPYHIYKVITGQKPDANVNNVFYASEKSKGTMHNLSVWIRSNFFIPDARALWINPSVKMLLTYLKKNPVDAIISNGPPHSNTRIATLLKKKTGIPWHADFQDPWSQVDYFSMLKLTRWGLKKHLKMEQEVFAYANSISIVSKSWAIDLEQIGAKNVKILPWGYDKNDFDGVEKMLFSGFSMVHAGILGNDRNPIELWEALHILQQDSPECFNQIQVHLYGLVDKTVSADIEQYRLTQTVKQPGSVSRNQAISAMMGSSVLLLLLNRQENAAGRIPGKFFEYLAAGRPILAIGPKESDIADLMAETSSGFYVPFGDIKACLSALYQLLHHYKKDTLSGAEKETIAQFSNKAITGKLAEILNNLT